MSTPTTTRTRSIRPAALTIAAQLLSEHQHLPAPDAVTITTHGLLLDLDSNTAVEAWAEAMGVDAEHQQHDDHSWTDRAIGEMPMWLGQVQVHVVHNHVEALPHRHIDACGAPRRCTHPQVCADTDECEAKTDALVAGIGDYMERRANPLGVL